MQQTLVQRLSTTDLASQPRQTNSVEAIYESFHRELWSLFYAFCNDAERAMDALQEAFLRLQQQDVNQITNPRAWLLLVGRNWLRDVARTRKNSETCRGEFYEALDSVESPWMRYARSETRQIVRDALDLLSEQDRLILALRFGMDWSAARIAESLECKPGAVDMRLSRARQRLRDLMLEMNPDFSESVL
ncbi:MAG TPA: sigma-70 family RNA polymerase sigma factor [Planctomycetaceae bacterium]|nr:sigma-70 family RNA polymerase sigma factor [Planctomycetaceae bacterium]